MKKGRKVLCIVLVSALVLLLLALSACGSFTPRMALGLQKLNALNSFHTDTTVTADMTVQAFGSETPLTLRFAVTGDHQKDPALTALKMNVSVFDVTEDLIVYIQTEGSKVTIYSSVDGGESWLTRVQVVDTDEAAEEGGAGGTKIGTAELLALAAALSENFDEVDMVEVSGEEGETDAIVRYEGVIPAALVQQVLDSTDVQMTLAGLASEYDITLPEDSSWLAADIPAAVVMDRQENTLMRVEFDLAGVINGVLGQITEAVLESYGLSADVLALQIDSVRIETDFSRFDDVSVTLPGSAA